MAISRIGSGGAEADNVTIPAGHQAGDFLLIYAFRDGSITSPSLPAGWTNIAAASGGTAVASRFGYKIAISDTDTSGTWTNATEIICVVYRGTSTSKTPAALPGNQTQVSNSVVYGNVSNTSSNGWIIAGGGHTSIDTTLETPPVNLTNVVDQVGATAEAVVHDSNGVFAGKYTGSTVVVGGTAGEYITTVIVIYPEEGLPNNYQFFKAGTGMSVSEKIR